MKTPEKVSIFWNPWHGCTKISPGCQHCYVYRMDKRFGRNPEICVPTGTLDLPIWKVGRKKSEKRYRISPGSNVMTCFTSDFLLKEADEFRKVAWDCIRERSDCQFSFITKRIDRFLECIPDDWGDGWDNVHVTCTIENQKMADYRLPIFLSLPIKHRSLCLEPLLEYVDLTSYLPIHKIDYVVSGGESGSGARQCRYEWIKRIKSDLDAHQIPLWFKQTGARFIDENGVLHRVARCNQFEEANKLGLSNFSLT